MTHRIAFYGKKGSRILDIESPGVEVVVFVLILRPTVWSHDGKFLILDQGTMNELRKSDVVALDPVVVPIDDHVIEGVLPGNRGRFTDVEALL